MSTEKKEITVNVLRLKNGKKLIQTDKKDKISNDQLFKAVRISEQLQKADEFYLKGNIEKAYTFYKFAAKSGDKHAAQRISDIVSKNDKIAFTHHKELADQGDLKAIKATAYAYFEGRGTKTDFKKGREYLQLSAEREDPESLLLLGNYCLSGLGGQKDYKKAMHHFKTAYEKLKYMPAQYILGLCYVLYGNRQEQKTGFNLLSDSVKQQDKAAEIRIGWCYMQGRGVEKNAPKAIQIFENCLARDKDNPDVMFYLASVLMFGPQHLRDRPRAIQLLTSLDAIFQQSPILATGGAYLLARCYRFGYGVLKDDKKAIEHLTRAIELGGDLPSRTMLAVCQLHNIGIPKNEELAIKTLKEIVGKKLPEAMTVLGVVKFMGWGKEKQNYQAAFNLFKQATHSDPLQYESDSFNNVGWCYLQGLGVEQNYRLAIQNFEEAKTRGNRVAINNLAWCYLNGLGVPKDNAKAKSLFLESHQHWEQEECLANTFGISYLGDWTLPSEITRLQNSNQPEIQYHLAICYLNGLGVEQDHKQAIEILNQLASKKSYPEAMLTLGMCYIEGRGLEKTKDLDLKAVSLFSQVANIETLAVGAEVKQQTEVKQKSEVKQQAEIKQKSESQGQDQQSTHKISQLKNQAFVRLALCRIYGRGVEKNYEQGFELLKLCADMGNAEAHFHLGLIFSQKQSQASDPSRLTDYSTAQEYFIQAAKRGHETAQQLMQELEPDPSEVSLASPQIELRTSAVPSPIALQVYQPVQNRSDDNEAEADKVQAMADSLTRMKFPNQQEKFTGSPQAKIPSFLPLSNLQGLSSPCKLRVSSSKGAFQRSLTRKTDLHLNSRILRDSILDSEFHRKNSIHILS